jgi:PAS domain S-box-containing protein
MIHAPFRFGVGACGSGAVDAGGRAAMTRPLDALGVVGVPDALAKATFVVVGVLVGWHTARLRALLRQAERAHARVAASEERFRVALQNSPIVLFNQDPDLRYTWVHNPHGGHALGDVLGRTDADLFAADDAARLTTIKRRVLESGVGAREEVALALGGEQVWYDLVAEPLRDGSGQIVGITCATTDVTARKQAQEALQQAQRAEGRLEGVSLAAREMAHLLNDDLALPVLALDVLQEQATLQPDHRHLLDMAISALASAADHIRQFQRVERVAIKGTPMGPSLDLARSVQGPVQSESQ